MYKLDKWLAATEVNCGKKTLLFYVGVYVGVK